MKLKHLSLLLLSVTSVCRAEVLYEWKLDKSHIQGNTLACEQKAVGKLQKPAKFDQDGILIFEKGQHILIDEKFAKQIPTNAFSVEADVRIDQPHRWGGIIGYSQDNGSHERGWLLGYTNMFYSTKGSVGGALKSAVSPKPFSPGQWAHVTSVFDGKQLKLYIDGRFAKSVNLKGRIKNDTIPTPFVIGAYKDKDEFFPLEGRIRSIKIHNVALSPKYIQKHVSDKQLQFSVRPRAIFTAPGEVVISWEATQPGPGALAYGTTKNFGKIIASNTDKTSHSVRITGLEPATKYYYRLGGKIDGVNKFSPIYELNTTMNMTVPPAPDVAELSSSRAATLAKKISDLSPQKAGICLVIGLDDGKLAYQLARHTKMKVICVETDKEKINKLRQKYSGTGVYGSRISILGVDDFHNVPLPRNIANVVVSEKNELPCTPVEAQLLTRPNSFLVMINGDKISATKKKLADTNDWSHQYGNAANTSNAGESLGGATKTKQLQVHWIGKPGGDFGIDRQPRMSGPLATNGRLFHQGFNRVVALDSYNGQILWGMEIPDLRRVNIPRDCANWCADKDHLYIAVKDRAWQINAANGEFERAFKLTESLRGTHDWGYIGVTDKLLIGSSVKAGAAYTNYWTGKAWYDGVNDRNASSQVVSDNLFGYNKSSGEGVWAYGKGYIINSTITISGNNIYFLENRSNELKPGPDGKIGSNKLWTKDLHVVCLNLDTGRPRWDKVFPPLKYVKAEKGHVLVGYGVAPKGRFIAMISQADPKSNKGFFTYYSFDAKTGKLQWQSETRWRTNNHGAHIQHPVVIKDVIYCDPTGVYLKDGKPIGHNYGPRAACAAAVGSSESIFYRGKGGMITMWGVDERKPSGFKRLRPSCWISFVPSNSMLLVPEGGAGCSCGGWMETSMGLAPVSKASSK